MSRSSPPSAQRISRIGGWVDVRSERWVRVETRGSGEVQSIAVRPGERGPRLL